MPPFRRPYLSYSKASRLVKLRTLENRNTIMAASAAVWITLGMVGAWMAANESTRFIGVYLAAWPVPAALMALHRLVVRRLRAQVLANHFMLCQRCRYPTDGLGASGVCPECGGRFNCDDQEAAWRTVIYAARTGNRPSFMVRQFTCERTALQHAFDTVFGVHLSIIYFTHEQNVFLRRGVLDGFRDAAYAGTAVAISILILWLVLGARTRTLASCLGGAMLASATVALFIGVAIFPLILFDLIDVFAIAPLLTVFPLLRNGVRAVRAGASSAHSTRMASIIAGGGIIVMASIAGHWIQYDGDPTGMISAFDDIAGLWR